MIKAGRYSPAVNVWPGSTWENGRVHVFSPDSAKGVTESFNQVVADPGRVVGEELVKLRSDLLPVSFERSR